MPKSKVRLRAHRKCEERCAPNQVLWRREGTTRSVAVWVDEFLFCFSITT